MQKRKATGADNARTHSLSHYSLVSKQPPSYPPTVVCTVTMIARTHTQRSSNAGASKRRIDFSIVLFSLYAVPRPTDGRRPFPRPHHPFNTEHARNVKGGGVRGKIAFRGRFAFSHFFVRLLLSCSGSYYVSIAPGATGSCW